MAKGSNYWQKRFEMLEDARNKTAKGTVQAVTPAFDQAQAQIEKEINAWYARFAKNNQISLLEAKKLLNTKELKEFHWDVQEYIKYGRQNALDQAWMKELENASARFHISRLEALKIHTQNAAERAFGNEVDQIDQMAARMYMDDYYHTAYEIQKGLGIGFDVSQIDQRKLDKILSKPWTTDKQTFSDRIWKSKTQLVDSLHKELTQMCVLGKAPDQTINAIAKRMNVSKGQAGRLVMTEAAYFGSVAQKDCFNDLDVEKYEIVATLDHKTSEICQKMDGQVFDMKDFQAGVTAPPFHVWCRSCTCPWFEDNDDGTRVARGEDGKTYQVPANMKYPDWKEYFVDKTKDPADWLKVASDEDLQKASKEIEELRKKHEGLKAEKENLSYQLKDKRRIYRSTFDPKQKWDLGEEISNIERRIYEINKQLKDMIALFESNDEYYDKLFKSAVREHLEDIKVDYLEITKLDKQLSIDEIVERVGGGDKTTGSCASLGFAYVGNRNGYNVLDFRGGKSCDTFATTANLREISKLRGVKTFTESGFNDITNCKKLLKNVEVGKEYYFVTGRHAAMVRKTEEGVLQYLELQSGRTSGYTNGWHNLDIYGSVDSTLSKRFGATKSRTSYGQKFEMTSFMIDSDTLKDNAEFRKLLGYINTAESAQRKGLNGTIK